MRFPGNTVTHDDTRTDGAGRPDKCFYCSGKPGGEHDVDCVIIQRPIKVRMTVELIIECPRSWTKENIEFHLNDSSWCVHNIIGDMERQAGPDGCLCHVTNFEYLGDATMEEAVAANMKPDTEE